MAIKLNLSSKEILEKQFEHVYQGYNALEVDEFLDRVIKDYQKAEENYLIKKSEIETLNGQIADLKEKIKALEIDNAKYKEVYEIAKNNTSASLDNIDLLKKIRAYENYIYKLGVNPNTIK